jgi:hypothetical protein
MGFHQINHGEDRTDQENVGNQCGQSPGLLFKAGPPVCGRGMQERIQAHRDPEEKDEDSVDIPSPVRENMLVSHVSAFLGLSMIIRARANTTSGNHHYRAPCHRSPQPPIRTKSHVAAPDGSSLAVIAPISPGSLGRHAAQVILLRPPLQDQQSGTATGSAGPLTRFPGARIPVCDGTRS